jgi:hypothetical protein
VKTYLNVAETAAVARKHPVTIRLALEGGTLHGTQQKVGGRWAIDAACAEAYIEGRPCEHRAAKAKITPIRGNLAA